MLSLFPVSQMSMPVVVRAMRVVHFPRGREKLLVDVLLLVVVVLY